MFTPAQLRSAGVPRAIANWFWTGLPAALVFAFMEAGAALYGERASVLRYGALLAYAGGLVVVTSLGVGGLTAGLGVLSRRLLPVMPEAFTLRFLAGLAAGTGNFFGGSYGITLFSGAFNNRELAALLSAVLHVAWAMVSVALGAFIWRFSVRLVSAGLAIVIFGCAPVIAVLWLNLDGFRQLSPVLWLGPVAAGVAWLLTVRFEFRRFIPRPLVVHAGLLILLLGSYALGTAQPQLASRFADSGGWTSFVIRGVHAVTDFDGDGYSSLMGGGDCRAFDAKVYPGALEIPNDGIDNNCVGGDSEANIWPQPSWYETPDTLSKRLNVLYVSIETLRADHLSAYGYARKTSPNIERLAKEASVFEHAYSPATYTALVLPSILSSLAPSQVTFARGSGRRRVAENVVWLPALLRQAGYRTTAIQTSVRVFSRASGLGLERGFDRYDDSVKAKHRGGTLRGAHAKEQVDLAIPHLKSGKQPFFLWVHLLEPHYAYEPPKEARRFGEERVDLYDAEIWEADRQLGRLLNALRKRKLWDDTIVIVSGDHGEEFGEHGQRFHGSNLYEPQVRTALILRVPGVAAQRVTAAASLTDLSPTLLNLLGLRAAFTQTHSRNLTPALFGQPLERSWFVSELFEKSNFSKYQASLIDWPLKLIYSGASGELQLFDVREDPLEKQPIAATDAKATAMRTLLLSFLDHHAKRPPAEPAAAGAQKK